MIPISPVRLILLGFALLLLGVILPFLMILQILESTLLLNFLAYMASLFGLLCGLVGIVLYNRLRDQNRN